MDKHDDRLWYIHLRCMISFFATQFPFQDVFNINVIVFIFIWWPQGSYVV